MDKLISQQAAIDALEAVKTVKAENGELYIAKINAQMKLETLPSIQSDIIRCKDCAYCDSDVVDAPYGMTEKIFWCDRLYAGTNENLIVEPDDFCSWAERRTDG